MGGVSMTERKGFSSNPSINTKAKTQQALNSKTQSGKKDASK